jgi:teichuronic acid biosynthesis protein TuaE
MLSATTLYYIVDEKRKRFYLVTMIINLFIVIGTVTRIQIIGAIIIVVSFVFKYLKEQLKQNKSIGLKVVCIFVIFVIMCGLLGTQVTKRNNAIHENIGINTSGRMEVWKVYWDISSINRKFGLGLGSVKAIQYKQYNNIYLKYFTVPHNEYLKFIIELGIIGFILIMLSFILVFRKLLKHNILGDWKFLIPVAIIVFAIASFTDNTISAEYYWIPFCLYIGLIYDENGVNTIKENGGVTND